MAPELVIADASFKRYPGGVIAIRCTDWTAGARGTLSTESDARAITGECVRDSQTVSASIFDDRQAALQTADDTLAIDLSDIPTETGMRYVVYASCIIEGDWDVTNTDTTKNSSADTFGDTCAFAWSFQSDFSGNIYAWVPNARRRPHFLLGEFEASFLVWDETDTMYFRAIAQDGTTVEWLIDQLIFVPYVFGGGTFAGQWKDEDFVGLVAQDGDQPADGADGGDANGKFTIHNNPHEAYGDIFSDTSGDYQRDPDDELMADVPVGYHYLVNSQTVAEAPAHAYSIHGADYREAGVLATDDFSRTTGPDDWGISDDGFAWYVNGGPSFAEGNWFCNGSQGVINSDAALGAYNMSRHLAFAGTPVGARIVQPDFTISGIVSYDQPVFDGAGTHRAFLRWCLSSVPFARSWHIDLNILTGSWDIVIANARANGSINDNNGLQESTWAGPFDVSSWLAANSDIGFRIEKKRYALRIKIWDATGAEPGTWDFDDFFVSDNGGGTLQNILAYPYGDSLNYAYSARIQGAMFPSVGMLWTDSQEWSSYWDDIVIEYDPGGDGGDVIATIDGPEFSEQITIPYGAWQMVYWGTGDWTELDGGDPWVVFTAKTWSESGAAELQRAHTNMWWFRTVHPGTIAPVFWKPEHKQLTRRRYPV